MYEETQTTNAMSEELDDDYDVDLSDLDLSTEEPDEDGNQTGGQEETGQTAQEDKQESEPAGTEGGQTGYKEPPTEETFDLKFNKEIRKVSRDEMTELAQKGLNHDRILAQRDELRGELDELRKYRDENSGYLTALTEAAEASGTDIPTFLRTLRENAYVSQGLSRDTAKERVLREEAERTLARTRAQENAAAEQTKSETAKRDEQKRDIERFITTYKGVEPESIPQEVWDAVRGGESLVSAYGRYETRKVNEENRKLQERIKAMEQNEKNKQAAVGSVKTDGKESAKDPFLAAFMSDDE